MLEVDQPETVASVCTQVGLFHSSGNKFRLHSINSSARECGPSFEERQSWTDRLLVVRYVP